MSELEIRLACTGCNGFEEWTQDGAHAVRCDRCGKKHHRDSLHAVEP